MMISAEIMDLDMFSIFELSPDLVCIADKAGYFKKINATVLRKLEYSAEELYSRPISSFIHPEDKEVTSRERKQLLAGKTLHNFENRYISKSGNILWLDWTSIYVPDKEIVFAVAKDVTDKKTAEKEIEEKYNKFKNLATHFKKSIEEDRKFIAVGLHEDLAQLASVVKLDLDWIIDHDTTVNEPTKKRINHALAVSSLLVQTIRRISFSISPNMLDDIGLQETLKWHCNEFSIISGIQCSFDGDIDESELTHEIKLDFFRICQKALLNVMYHSRAQTVQVLLRKEEDAVHLTICDDGIGFDVAITSTAGRLQKIKERVSSVNGQFELESAPGKGTVLHIAIKI